MILISVTVHEKIGVVLDQIANFKRFAPDAYLVIHPSRQFVEAHPESLAALHGNEGVLVNPEPLYTGTGSVLKCHVSNFIHAEKTGIPFSHYCLHSSNDMFVRKGVENYIRRHDFGFFRMDVFHDVLGFSHWKTDFLNDKSYGRMMRSMGLPPTHYVSQAEGTFYPYEAFSEFAARFMRYVWAEIPRPFRYVHGTNRKLVALFEKIQRIPAWRKHIGRYFYTKEEFYPPNFFSAMCASPGTPYCYMNWSQNLQVTNTDIECIRKGGVPDNVYRDLYSVKRVNRHLDDPLRTMIRSLD